MKSKKPSNPVVEKRPAAEPKPQMVKKYFVSDAVKGISIGSMYFARGEEVMAPVPQFFIDNGQVVRKLVPKK